VLKALPYGLHRAQSPVPSASKPKHNNGNYLRREQRASEASHRRSNTKDSRHAFDSMTEAADVRTNSAPRYPRARVTNLRLQLKPAHEAYGFVQGAWWPRSDQLGIETSAAPRSALGAVGPYRPGDLRQEQLGPGTFDRRVSQWEATRRHKLMRTAYREQLRRLDMKASRYDSVDH
jgi:Family of unknown function (DUF5994)